MYIWRADLYIEHACQVTDRTLSALPSIHAGSVGRKSRSDPFIRGLGTLAVASIPAYALLCHRLRNIRGRLSSVFHPS